MSDTPETDKLISDWYCNLTNLPNFVDIARKFERERDEAREQIKELIYIGERSIALAEIDLENDKFGVVSELRAELDQIKDLQLIHLKKKQLNEGSQK